MLPFRSAKESGQVCGLFALGLTELFAQNNNATEEC